MSTRVDTVSLRTAEQLVDALNQAIDMDGGPSPRIEFMLTRLQALLDRQARVSLWILEDLKREPAPLIISRTVVRPDFDDGAPVDMQVAQRVLEDTMPVSRAQIRQALARARTPATIVLSKEGETAWFERTVVQPYFAPMGYVDCMTSMWAASADRATLLICLRREVDRPFSDADTALLSLALRAVAPIVDRDMFRLGSLSHNEELSDREREILLMLLAGDSEKEIAHALSRSPHTVHTFVQRLYRMFEVSSRGELMALFVDKSVLATLQDTLPDGSQAAVAQS